MFVNDECTCNEKLFPLHKPTMTTKHRMRIYFECNLDRNYSPEILDVIDGLEGSSFFKIRCPR